MSDLAEIAELIRQQKKLAKDQALKIQSLRFELTKAYARYYDIKDDYNNLKNDYKLVNICWCLVGLMVGIITGVMI